MGRVALRVAASVLVATAVARAEPPKPPVSLAEPATVHQQSLAVTLFADRDDDDDDGRADVLDDPRDKRASTDLVWLDAAVGRGGALTKIDGTALRAVADGRAVTQATLAGPRRARRWGLQGIEPGVARLDLGGTEIDARVVEVLAVDAKGTTIDQATSHASIARSLPPALRSSGDSDDADALRWLAIGPPEALPTQAKVVSNRPDGHVIDEIGALPLDPTACPPAIRSEFRCRISPPIRATVDDIDRSHPETIDRSLRAEVGGRIVLSVGGRKAASLRVGGPRESSMGPLARFRVHLRMHVVRASRGGAVPIGGDDAGALGIARSELETASSVWGQCGIHFGAPKDQWIRVEDPPPPFLLALGCELALPASGGEIAFRVGTAVVRVPTHTGESALDAAAGVARAARAVGLSADVSPNAQVSYGAGRTADVLLHKADGSLATIEPVAGAPLSTDATLTACVGSVDLSDGLAHFTDLDASAGTLEERTLIKAYDDGDPTTIELIVIPAFAQAGRIGESFIYADGGSVRNVVILDRAGIRAGARSFALAHELGHILLDMPGHPDDFGVDQPSSLMDADAADPSIFGPRRLALEECERAVRQNGPSSPVPLLEAWPLYGALRGISREAR